MSNYGMKVALPGYDVATALPHQCSIHSSYPCPKIDSSKGGYLPDGQSDIHDAKHGASITITFANNPPNDAETILFSINHNLGYIPMAIARGVFTDGSTFALEGTLPIEPTGTISFFTETTTTHFYIKMYYNVGWGSMSGQAVGISYQLFVEDGA